MSVQEFTGERFIPGQGSVQLAYEHLHRYFFALRWAAGKRVLDVASGSGYGAALLANAARQVWAIDIDGPTVAHARRAFGSANLCFINADGGCLPFPTGAMDLIVAFEVIEHVLDQGGMIGELARVLKPGGLALISTPDKATYSDARQYVNPFHLREFYREDFLELLHSKFASVRLLQQQVRAGSLITGGQSSAAAGEILVGPMPGEEPHVTSPMYFLACCGSGDSDSWPAESAYLDSADSLVREWNRSLMDAGSEIERLNEEIRQLGRWGRNLESQLSVKDETLKEVLAEIDKRDRTIKDRDEMIRSLQAELGQEVEARDQIIRDLQDKVRCEISQRDHTIRGLQEEFEGRTKWALSLQEDVRARDERLDATDASLKSVSAHLAHIRHAFLYRVLCRLGILPK